MLKLIHITCAVLTISLFCLRGIWMLTESKLLQHRFIRILPHIIDTVLLTTGVLLIIKFYSNLFYHHWLMLKLLAVFTYILTGSIALKYGRTKKHRTIAFAGSCLLLVFIVSLAVFRPYFNF